MAADTEGHRTDGAGRPSAGPRLDDQPGGLNAILQALDGRNVNIEYMYAFVQRDQESAAMIFRFDKVDQAVDVLKNNGFNIIPAERLCAY